MTATGSSKKMKDLLRFIYVGKCIISSIPITTLNTKDFPNTSSCVGGAGQENPTTMVAVLLIDANQVGSEGDKSGGE
ncbi:hypothetical protein U1Q18_026294 [Sarracenia purpurea var. burkii]